MCVHVHKGQRRTSVGLFHRSLPCCFQLESLAELGVFPDIIDSQSQLLSCFFLHETWGSQCTHPHLAFSWIVGIQTPVLTYRKHPYPLSHLPGPCTNCFTHCSLDLGCLGKGPHTLCRVVSLCDHHKDLRVEYLGCCLLCGLLRAMTIFRIFRGRGGGGAH